MAASTLSFRGTAIISPENGVILSHNPAAFDQRVETGALARSNGLFVKRLGESGALYEIRVVRTKLTSSGLGTWLASLDTLANQVLLGTVEIRDSADAVCFSAPNCYLEPYAVESVDRHTTDLYSTDVRWQALVTLRFRRVRR